MSTIVKADILNALNSKSGVLGLAEQIKISDDTESLNVAEVIGEAATEIQSQSQELQRQKGVDDYLYDQIDKTTMRVYRNGTSVDTALWYGHYFGCTQGTLPSGGSQDEKWECCTVNYGTGYHAISDVNITGLVNNSPGPGGWEGCFGTYTVQSTVYAERFYSNYPAADEEVCHMTIPNLPNGNYYINVAIQPSSTYERHEPYDPPEAPDTESYAYTIKANGNIVPITSGDGKTRVQIEISDYHTINTVSGNVTVTDGSLTITLYAGAAKTANWFVIRVNVLLVSSISNNEFILLNQTIKSNEGREYQRIVYTLDRNKSYLPWTEFGEWRNDFLTGTDGIYVDNRFSQVGIEDSGITRYKLSNDIEDNLRKAVPKYLAATWDDTDDQFKITSGLITSLEIGDLVAMSFNVEDENNSEILIPTTDHLPGNIKNTDIYNVSSIYTSVRPPYKISITLENSQGGSINLSRAGAGATTISFGSNKFIEIEYSGLVDLLENENLVPGQKYRITDYITTAVLTNTDASNAHQFDIIVEALAKDRLSENVLAIQSPNDAYFDNCNLGAWELKYTIDNLEWSDQLNGKGTIYWMKDEWGNEAPYDFKNIMFRLDTSVAQHLGFDDFLTDVFGSSWESSLPNEFYYTFSWVDSNDEVLDASIVFNDGTVGNGLGGNAGCTNNKIGGIGDGPLYNMFLNTYYCGATNYGCSNNIISPRASANMFGNGTSSNKLGSLCSNNVLSNGNIGVIFNDTCTQNILGTDCSGTEFGFSCMNNTLGSGSDTNHFGDYCTFNNLGAGCSGNTFEYYNNTCTLPNNTKWCNIGKFSSYITLSISTSNTLSFTGIVFEPFVSRITYQPDSNIILSGDEDTDIQSGVKFATGCGDNTGLGKTVTFTELNTGSIVYRPANYSVITI